MKSKSKRYRIIWSNADSPPLTEDILKELGPLVLSGEGYFICEVL